MTTGKALRRRMVQLEPALGRGETVGGLTTTTVTVAALAVGSWSEQKFIGRFAVRADSTALADRIRRISAFTASTGVLTHAGTNYSDTTATSELVEILEFEPYLYDVAINEALVMMRQQYTIELPTIQAYRRYSLRDFDWIEGPADIAGLRYTSNPVYSRNRFFEKWSSYSTGGVLQADNWTLAGTSATAVRATTSGKPGYSVTLTRSSNDLTYSQQVELLDNGVSGESLRGRTITAFVRCETGTASFIRPYISDGQTTTTGNWHSGGGLEEELTVSATIASDALSLTFGVQCQGSDTTAKLNEAGIVESYDDAVRRDSWPDSPVDYDYLQSEGILVLPEISRNGQYLVDIARPYPRFDETRLRSGAFDADTCDAPEKDTAVVACWLMYRGLADRKNENTQKYKQMADTWQMRAEPLIARHTVDNSPEIKKPVPMSLGPRRGVRL